MKESYGIVQEHWDKILALFKKNPKIEAVILFGSRAKGNFKPGSDIDLALQGKGLTLSDFTPIQLAYEELYLPWKLDLVLYDSISHPDLVEHIQRVGVKVV